MIEAVAVAVNELRSRDKQDSANTLSLLVSRLFLGVAPAEEENVGEDWNTRAEYHFALNCYGAV